MKKISILIFFVVAILTVNSSCKKTDGTPPNTDSTGWRELGDLNATSGIYAVAVDKDDNVYAAVGSGDPGLKSYIAKWNGSSWSKLGEINTKNDNIRHLFVDGNNDLYAEVDAVITSYIAKWDGSTLKSITNDDIFNPEPEIYGATIGGAGKLYAVRQDYPIPSVVKYADTGWAQICSLPTHVYGPIAVDNNGNIHTVIMNADSNIYVANWDGNTWIALGDQSSIKNLLKTDVIISILTIDSKGNLYAGGTYAGVGISFLIKWDGTSWTEMKYTANTIGTYINCLATDANNDLYVGGETGNSSGDLVAYKWDGNRWTQLNKVVKNLTMQGRILSLGIDSKRNIYAGGNFDKIVNSHIVHYIAVYPGQ